ncbi:MAG: YHS domain-containing protein [Rhodopseudomonas palustris]|nr:YHS domain-containing protein [Rhodopseudomonas palustris]
MVTITMTITTRAATPAAGEVIDPVCGMRVDPATTPHHFDYHGQSYHFCAASCRGKFAADPESYLDPAKRKPAPEVPEGTIFTCPMHPEIRQDRPGHLPDLRHGARAGAGDARRRAQSRTASTCRGGSGSGWR